MADVEVLNENFTVNSNLNRLALIVFIGLEMIAALCANLFILLYTVCHPKVLKHPANIFLTNFVLGSLLATVLYMPSMIVTAAAGEWVFGTTLEEKVGTCQFFGFVYSLSVVYLSTFSLTMISVDRFLFIVKPFLHRRIMKTHVAVIINISIWIISLMMSCTPLFGLGNYFFREHLTTCIAAWEGNLAYVIVNLIFVVMICAPIITITSIWTYCFTYRYIKKISTRHQSASDSNNVKHVYRVRVCKIVGLFGSMLFVTAVSYGLGIGTAFIGVIVGAENVPGLIYTSALVLILLNAVLNPIVQSYFRKELNEFIAKYITQFTDFIKRTFFTSKRSDLFVSVVASNSTSTATVTVDLHS